MSLFNKCDHHFIQTEVVGLANWATNEIQDKSVCKKCGKENIGSYHVTNNTLKEAYPQLWDIKQKQRI